MSVVRGQTVLLLVEVERELIEKGMIFSVGFFSEHRGYPFDADCVRGPYLRAGCSQVHFFLR